MVILLIRACILAALAIERKKEKKKYEIKISTNGK